MQVNQSGSTTGGAVLTRGGCSSVSNADVLLSNDVFSFGSSLMRTFVERGIFLMQSRGDCGKEGRFRIKLYCNITPNIVRAPQQMHKIKSVGRNNSDNFYLQ